MCAAQVASYKLKLNDSISLKKMCAVTRGQCENIIFGHIWAHVLGKLYMFDEVMMFL